MESAAVGNGSRHRLCHDRGLHGCHEGRDHGGREHEAAPSCSGLRYLVVSAVFGQGALRPPCRAITYDDSVVSTGARSAERRDLVSTIGGLLLREGPSARPFGPWSGRRKSFAFAICDSPAPPWTQASGFARSM